LPYSPPTDERRLLELGNGQYASVRARQYSCGISLPNLAHRTSPPPAAGRLVLRSTARTHVKTAASAMVFAMNTSPRAKVETATRLPASMAGWAVGGVSCAHCRHARKPVRRKKADARLDRASRRAGNPRRGRRRDRQARAQIEDDGGASRRPIPRSVRRHAVAAGSAAPLDRVEPTPYQRDPSDAHVKRLMGVIETIGRFLDPIVVVREMASTSRRTGTTGCRR
jgi:hypothetical protein